MPCVYFATSVFVNKRPHYRCRVSVKHFPYVELRYFANNVSCLNLPNSWRLTLIQVLSGGRNGVMGFKFTITTSKPGVRRWDRNNYCVQECNNTGPLTIYLDCPFRFKTCSTNVETISTVIFLHLCKHLGFSSTYKDS